MICNPGNIEEPMKPHKSRNIWVWKSPGPEQLKINVGDFFLEASRQEGIGGALRDFEGKVLL